MVFPMVLGLHSSLALRPNKRFTIRNKHKNLWNLTNTHTHTYTLSLHLSVASPPHTQQQICKHCYERDSSTKRVLEFDPSIGAMGITTQNPKKNPKKQSR
jgi:hypothetical protein